MRPLIKASLIIIQCSFALFFTAPIFGNAQDLEPSASELLEGAIQNSLNITTGIVRGREHVIAPASLSTAEAMERAQQWREKLKKRKLELKNEKARAAMDQQISQADSIAIVSSRRTEMYLEFEQIFHIDSNNNSIKRYYQSCDNMRRDLLDPKINEVDSQSHNTIFDGEKQILLEKNLKIPRVWIYPAGSNDRAAYSVEDFGGYKPHDVVDKSSAEIIGSHETELGYEYIVRTALENNETGERIFHTLSICPDKNFSVTSFLASETPTGIALFESHSSDFRTIDGILYPYHHKAVHRNKKGEIVVESIFEIEDAKFNVAVDETLFIDMQIPEGARIFDTHFDPPLVYKVRKPILDEELVAIAQSILSNDLATDESVMHTQDKKNSPSQKSESAVRRVVTDTETEIFIFSAWLGRYALHLILASLLIAGAYMVYRRQRERS